MSAAGPTLSTSDEPWKIVQACAPMPHIGTGEKKTASGRTRTMVEYLSPVILVPTNQSAASPPHSWPIKPSKDGPPKSLLPLGNRCRSR